MYTVILSKQAVKDKALLKAAKLDKKAKDLLDILIDDPLKNSQQEALLGQLHGKYSRRINYQHRLVYEVIESKKIVHILRMWTHYE